MCVKEKLKGKSQDDQELYGKTKQEVKLPRRPFESPHRRWGMAPCLQTAEPDRRRQEQWGEDRATTSSTDDYGHLSPPAADAELALRGVLKGFCSEPSPSWSLPHLSDTYSSPGRHGCGWKLLALWLEAALLLRGVHQKHTLMSEWHWDGEGLQTNQRDGFRNPWATWEPWNPLTTAT